ncbi:MAG: Stp1/IreP family PP2C-type Ser/Thr phosphatase [Cyanophyceae cyanobacterium]
MNRRFAGLTDPGLVRATNQDNYYIDPAGRFFVVADGMGGHAGGQEASQIAICHLQTYLDQHWEAATPSPELLGDALTEANQKILADQRQHPERSDMGTTVVVVVFRQDQPWCAHVGDSRLYRLRETLEQMTEDETWVAQAIRAGELTARQARQHPWRHVLSKCLGRQDLSDIEVHPLDVKRGDRLLLCSDGLTEEVPDELIENLLQSSASCEEAATKLVEQAKQAGGADNVTVIVIAQDSQQ